MRYCIFEARNHKARCIVIGQCAACAAYQRGDFPPHFNVPTTITRNHVLASCIDPDNGLLVIWFVDGAIAW